MLNQNSDTLSDSTISLTSSMSASNIVHSSSANNLHLNVSGGIMSNNNNTNHHHLDSTSSPTTFTSSKSIHSFSSVTDSSNTKHKQIQDEKETVAKQIANVTAGMGAITKFMKESSDNISKREISSTNGEMVSIGCQTISTGEVTVTNIYIE